MRTENHPEHGIPRLHPMRNPRAVVAPTGFDPDFAFAGDSVFRDSLPPRHRRLVRTAARVARLRLDSPKSPSRGRLLTLPVAPRRRP